MDTLTVNLHTIDDKTMFSATARDNPELIIDYFPPIGTGKGYTSLELLMLSLGSCLSTTLLTLMRFRMKKSVSGISANVEGVVREEHPRALEQITVLLNIQSEDLTELELQEALNLAENTLCPVWAMLKGNTSIEVKTEINS